MYAPGDRIGERYTVVRSIGSGGMGEVYEVESAALGNRLAMKVMSPELGQNLTVVARFKQEARIQATMSHPGICKVFDLVEHDGKLGIVMEYVPAPTLRELLDEGPLPERVVRGVLFEVLSTLMACHEQDIVHRDLKPENIFVIVDSHDTIRCKLADFGVAKDMTRDGSDKANLTRTRTFVGTYTYASPEQISSSAKVDPRTDLYSLGVILWEMLAGVPPYADLDSAYSIQVAVVTEELPELPQTVGTDLRRVVAELTRKDPAERPQSTREVMQLLQVSARKLEASTAGVRRPFVPRETVAAAPAPRRDPLLDDVRPEPAAEAPPPAEVTPEPAPEPPAAPSTPSQTATQWDPTPAEEEAHAPALRRARRLERERQREARLAKLETPLIGSRMLARTLDEVLLQLLVVSCVGAVAYPVAVLFRGSTTGRSLGSGIMNYGVYDERTGQPARMGQMIGRNLVDLVLLQGPLALTLFWPGWAVGLPIISLPWFLIGLTIELIVAVRNPDGRRLADLIADTRVGKPA